MYIKIKNISISLMGFAAILLPSTGCIQAQTSGYHNESGNLVYEKNLLKHIETLTKYGQRNLQNANSFENLNKAANYILNCLKNIGCKTNFYTYTAEYEKSKQRFKVKNIEAVIEGIDSSPSDPYIVIGAHYDTVDGSPGADDNASGVAALLEIARHLFSVKHLVKRTIKLVVFPNEERPYSVGPETTNARGSNMGSVVYAKTAKRRGDRIDGMICLESIAYYSDELNSQKYPAQFSHLQNTHPKGNYVTFISDSASKPFLDEFCASYNQSPGAFPMLAFSLPQNTEDIGRSDHKSFWLEGYPAFMITDTADLRNDNYHTETDTLNSINFDTFTKVTRSICSAIEKLVCENRTTQKHLSVQVNGK